jgi:hypothetical protein
LESAALDGLILLLLFDHRASFFQQHDEEYRVAYNRNPTTVRRKTIRGMRDLGADAQPLFDRFGLMPETNAA